MRSQKLLPKSHSRILLGSKHEGNRTKSSSTYGTAISSVGGTPCGAHVLCLGSLHSQYGMSFGSDVENRTMLSTQANESAPLSVLPLPLFSAVVSAGPTVPRVERRRKWVLLERSHTRKCVTLTFPFTPSTGSTHCDRTALSYS